MRIIKLNNKIFNDFCKDQYINCRSFNLFKIKQLKRREYRYLRITTKNDSIFNYRYVYIICG